MHRSCKEAFNDKQRLSTSKAMTTLRKESAQLQRELKELQKQKELFDSRVAVVDNEHKGVLEKIENQKKELENVIFESTGKKVHVSW